MTFDHKLQMMSINTLMISLRNAQKYVTFETLQSAIQRSEANDPPLPCSLELYLKSATMCPGWWVSIILYPRPMAISNSSNSTTSFLEISNVLTWLCRFSQSEVVAVGLLRQKKTNRFREHWTILQGIDRGGWYTYWEGWKLEEKIISYVHINISNPYGTFFY